MKRELEKKFSVPNREAFLSLLRSHGIQLAEPIEQCDSIYFRKGKGFIDLPNGEPVLRIRKAGNLITTTLKIYRNGVSDRTEVECGILDPTSFDEYLRCLDFEKIVDVIKTRRKAVFRGAKIVLDEVSGLGTFAEIEVTTDDDSVSVGAIALAEAIEELGLNVAEAVELPYDEMLFNKARGELSR